MLIELRPSGSWQYALGVIMLAVLFNAVARPELATAASHQMAGMECSYWIVILAAIGLVARRAVAERLRGAIQARC
jgi:hypothetical protein